ncbi:hypothetical protein SS1G_08977 [Sclerotinia sclerotiorum 1980 UF-70]|uniref:Uncharacterized protein n=2 Tax=Sclerotinia sclerotiorum (strain ATCC 18683 / 1980 / Ss-1) TaxID=665079 RepID=A7EUH0_SCLS1|nr:hypothetical protein SS1G_08977 [Sclerotinia sclerotiorum 1980 UF-70]APA15336.1 hypothetical protein sscle_14g101060 [Sclerotinia sclerotiorum 1980 UF-70]EDN93112.1 hypothetical protein SS1G_08977 [Sclerotinia sclerotiorum 1980 UF-70]
MAYVLYTTVFIFLVISTIAFITRDRWSPYIPEHLLERLPRFMYTPYHALPHSFENDIESGLSSSNFNLSQNLLDSDPRNGLSDNGKREIQMIMKKKKVNFDEARRLWMQETFKKQNIGPDGRPRDPKFVSFS